MLDYSNFVVLAAIIQSQSRDEGTDAHMFDCYNKYLTMSKEDKERFIESNNVKPTLRKLCRNLNIQVI